MFKRLTKYTIGGLLGFVVQLFIAVLLKEIFHIPLFIAYAFALGSAIVIAFLYHKHRTFHGRVVRSKAFHKFAMYFSLRNFIDYFLVLFFTNFFFINYLVAIVSVGIFFGIVSFFVVDYWVF